MVDRIAELAERFDSRWSAHGRPEHRFAQIAAQALQDTDLSPLADTVELIRWLDNDPAVPPGRAGENDYGEPTITVFRGQGFRIEVIFWQHKPIGTHDHGSPGAFAVLSGARLHNTYEFLDRAPLCEGIETGTLARTTTERLDRGDIRPIDCLDEFIHSLFLLEPICTSLAIRSQTRAPGHTRAYFAPGVAWSRALDRHFAKHSEVLGLLGKLDAAALSTHLLELASGPLESAVYALLAMGSVGVPVDTRALAEHLTRRHGHRASLLLASAAQERTRRRIMQQVNQRSPSRGARLLLGLVWSATDIRTAAHIIRQHAPDRAPGPLVVQCLDELSEQPGPGGEAAAGDPVDQAIRQATRQAIRCVFDRVLEPSSDRDRAFEDALKLVAGHPLLGSLC